MIKARNKLLTALKDLPISLPPPSDQLKYKHKSFIITSPIKEINKRINKTGFIKYKKNCWISGKEKVILNQIKPGIYRLTVSEYELVKE